MTVGTATIDFSSCSAMTVDYTFDAGENMGATGSLSLSRLGPSPLNCSL